MHRYGQVIAKHPYAVAGSVIVLTCLCVTTTILSGKFPDFSDPQLGFETRGTKIARRLTTWANLLKATQPGGSLLTNPERPSHPPPLVPTRRPKGETLKSTATPSDELTPPKASGAPGNALTPPRSVPLKGRGQQTQGPYKYWNNNMVADSDVGHMAWGPNNNATHMEGATDRLEETLQEEESGLQTLNDPDDNNLSGSLDDDKDDEDDEDHDHPHLAPDGFFCEHLSSSYSHLVIKSLEPSLSLMSVEGVTAVCRLQSNLMDVDLMNGLCQTVRRGQCCSPWSVPNYIAMLHNRTDCFHITKSDVSSTLAAIRECHRAISENLALNRPNNSSGLCRQDGHVFAMLYYLMDSNFDGGEFPLESTMLFLPIARSASVLPYFRALGPQQLRNELVVVPAADFGAKGALFDLYLLRGTRLMAGAFIFIVGCLWTYTGSLFLTMCSVLAVAMSLVMAHFLYTHVFAITFFPFMNLLAVVVSIGIGADDAFIYCKLHRCTKESCNGGPSTLVSSALRAAAPSMCVTSLTTAAALFANCISPISAINCFSLFAGTAVLVNLVLMLSWLPACVVIADRWCCPPVVPLQWRPVLNMRIRTAKEYVTQIQVLIDRCLLLGVIRLRWMWALMLGGVAVAAAIIVLHYPKLRLPDTKAFPLFEAGHPFEQYETKYGNSFWFQRDDKENAWSEEGGRLPLQFVWGVIPTDNGNHLDPSSRGQLLHDPDFDITSNEAQTWLLEFCRDIRLQPFYQPTLGPLLSNCFIESFKSWMSRRCKAVAGEDRSPCCEKSPFPFTRRVFTQCLPRAIAHLHATPASLFTPGPAGPKFSRGKRNEIKAIVIEYESNYTYSNSFVEMSAFYESIESWFKEKLSTAPTSLRGGWFVSDLGFWDLQASLSEGTQAAIALSLAVSLLVVFFTTLNGLLAILTVLTVAANIFVTVAVLVLMGWRLNVLESVAVTTAIGLSVDFPLHYAVHYRLADEQLREPAVVHALTRMTGPTAMAALTTGAAGAFMSMASALPYIQIGMFLVVLTLVSWIYSTLFLMSLLAIAGPQHGCSQLAWPEPSKWFREPTANKSAVPAMWSDTTLSTSSGVVEMHELEALTRAQRRRPPRAQSPAMPDDVEVFPS